MPSYRPSGRLAFFFHTAPDFTGQLQVSPDGVIFLPSFFAPPTRYRFPFIPAKAVQPALSSSTVLGMLPLSISVSEYTVQFFLLPVRSMPTSM